MIDRYPLAFLATIAIVMATVGWILRDTTPPTPVEPVRSVVPATAAPAVTVPPSSTAAATVAGGALGDGDVEVSSTTVVVPVTVGEPVVADTCGGLVPTIERFWPADQVGKVCAVIACETGHTFSPTIENPRSSASGILQFLDGTWRQARQYIAGASQYARAAHAPVEMQIAVGAEWWHRTSWSQWECA